MRPGAAQRFTRPRSESRASAPEQPESAQNRLRPIGVPDQPGDRGRRDRHAHRTVRTLPGRPGDWVVSTAVTAEDGRAGLIARATLVKGRRVGKDAFVLLSDEELEAVQAEAKVFKDTPVELLPHPTLDVLAKALRGRRPTTWPRRRTAEASDVMVAALKAPEPAVPADAQVGPEHVRPAGVR
jgi:hypothetical protein